MAKFCTKCGKELVDGKCVDCKEEQVTVTPISTKNPFQNFDFNGFVNSILDMAKGMFQKPSDTIKKYTSDAHALYGIIAMALCAIVTGIFGYLMVTELMGSIYSLMYGGYSSFMDPASLTSEISAFKVIVITALFAAISFACIIGVVYLMVKYVFKKDVSIKKVAASFGPLAVFNIVNLLVSIVLLYISVKLMFIVYLLLSLCYVVYMIQAIKIATDVEDNRLAYTYVSAIAVTSFVVAYILPKLFI